MQTAADEGIDDLAWVENLQEKGKQIGYYLLRFAIHYLSCFSCKGLKQFVVLMQRDKYPVLPASKSKVQSYLAL